jgi:hypothetical protein
MNTKFVYASTRAKKIVGYSDDYATMSREDAEEKYLTIYRYYSSLIDEILSFYKKKDRGSVEFYDYISDLNHETEQHGCIVINTIRNYYWYLRNDKEKASGSLHMLWHHFFNFVIGVQAVEIFYYTIFQQLKGEKD